MRNFKRNRFHIVLTRCDVVTLSFMQQPWTTEHLFHLTTTIDKWYGILHSCFVHCEISLVQNSAPHDCTLTIIYAVLHLVWTDKLLVALCLVRTKEVSILCCTIFGSIFLTKHSPGLIVCINGTFVCDFGKRVRTGSPNLPAGLWGRVVTAKMSQSVILWKLLLLCGGLWEKHGDKPSLICLGNISMYDATR